MDCFGNNNLNSSSAQVNLFGLDVKEWLISPTIDLGNSQNYQLEFDIIGTTYSELIQFWWELMIL